MPQVARAQQVCCIAGEAVQAVLAQRTRWDELAGTWPYRCVHGVMGCHSRCHAGVQPPVIPSVLCEDHVNEAVPGLNTKVQPCQLAYRCASQPTLTVSAALTQVIPTIRRPGPDWQDDPQPDDEGDAPQHEEEVAAPVRLSFPANQAVADAAVARAASLGGREQVQGRAAFVPASSPYCGTDRRWGDVYKCLHVRCRPHALALTHGPGLTRVRVGGRWLRQEYLRRGLGGGARSRGEERRGRLTKLPSKAVMVKEILRNEELQQDVNSLLFLLNAQLTSPE